MLPLADLAVRSGSGGERGSKETVYDLRRRPRYIADDMRVRVPGTDGEPESGMPVLYDNVGSEPSHYAWYQ